jgi:sirohydrochlorin ferrochelatase
VPTTNPDLATLLAAVERELDEPYVDICLLRDAADDLANAFRTARDSGYAVALVRPGPRCLTCGSRRRESDYGPDVPDGMVPVLVSREAIEALRKAFEVPVADDMTGRWVEATRLLWIDLAGLLKETK